VVDDEPDFVELAQYNLAHRGYEVFTALNGIQALHQARRVLPDLILLDLMLPDIDGASVCEILRAQPSTADVPVIVVSALDGMITRNRSAEAGVCGHFKKPVDAGALEDCMQQALKQKQERLRTRMNEDKAAPR